jgi:cytochrome oxidase Cu insertion factor (SCO1/SenC/PrrC family)
MKVQLSLSLVAAVASFVMSGASALWFTSSKNTEMTRMKSDVEAVVKSDDEQGRTLTRLDERTIIILDTVRRLEERRGP